MGDMGKQVAEAAKQAAKQAAKKIKQAILKAIAPAIPYIAIAAAIIFIIIIVVGCFIDVGAEVDEGTAGMTGTVGASDEAAEEMLKSFENEALSAYMRGDSSVSYSSVSEYVTEDRKYYKMYYTSFDGCLNFSYGIMVRSSEGILNNTGYFSDEGLNLSELVSKYNSGQTVLVEVEKLDNIHKKIFKDKQNTIASNATATFTSNQLEALAMVSYQYGNCGEYLSGANNVGAMYKKYGNTENFRVNVLCLTSIGSLCHFWNAGEYSNREKYTWKLFHEGVYTLRDGTVITPSKGGTIIECAERIHEYMEKNKYEYCVLNIIDCEHINNLCGLNTTFEESKKGYHNTCCATYVAWVLIEAGYLDSNEMSHGAITLANILKEKGFKQVSASNLQAGDIMCYNYGHIEIYAGNGTIYNAGSIWSVQNAAPSNQWNTPDYALRAPKKTGGYVYEK